ncbi:MAG: M48 family metalloprotease [Armatimonadota bacterium]
MFIEFRYSRNISGELQDKPMTYKYRYTVFLFILMLTFGMAASEQAWAKTTVKEEIEIGQKSAKEIEKEFPVTENKEWLKEIDSLGRLLTPYVKRKEIPYTFKIIKEETKGKPELDAFSLPGGPVYFSERMWRVMTRDERIGILAHEISHIDKRHAIDTMSEMQRRSMWTTAVMIITGAGGNWWDAADLANTLYTLKFSRKREKEADMMAVDLTTAAGQTPAGLVTALEKLLRVENEAGDKPPKILSTHPATDDRVKYLTERCLELGVKPEAMELKFNDQPNRLGDVKDKKKKDMLVNVTTAKPLAINSLVWIKKPLWDEEKNVVAPKPVARGVALTEGTEVQVSVKMEPGFDFSDIESGDGVYPREPDPAPVPPKIKIIK